MNDDYIASLLVAYGIMQNKKNALQFLKNKSDKEKSEILKALKMQVHISLYQD